MIPSFVSPCLVTIVMLTSLSLYPLTTCICSTLIGIRVACCWPLYEMAVDSLLHSTLKCLLAKDFKACCFFLSLFSFVIMPAAPRSLTGYHDAIAEDCILMQSKQELSKATRYQNLIHQTVFKQQL